MSRLSNLLPLIALILVVGGGAYIGYQIYLWSNDLGDRGRKHLEKKHMSFTKEGGLKVEVKQKSEEQYEDRTQNVLMKVLSTSTEAMKSNNAGGSGTSTPSRPGNSRAASSQQQQSRTTSAQPATNVAPAAVPRVASEQKSAGGPPGGW